MDDEKFKQAGDRLRALRKETGQSIYKIAKKLNISGNYLSLLERGKQSPSDQVIYNIAEFYNIDSSELFSLYNKEDPGDAENIKNLNPHLREILTQLSIDKRLSESEKVALSENIKDLINEYLDSKED